MGIVAHFVMPKSPTQSFVESVPNLHGNGWPYAWMHFVNSYPMHVVVFAVMVGFAVYRRGPLSWIFALVAGLALPDLFLFHWL